MSGAIPRSCSIKAIDIRDCVAIGGEGGAQLGHCVAIARIKLIRELLVFVQHQHCRNVSGGDGGKAGREGEVLVKLDADGAECRLGLRALLFAQYRVDAAHLTTKRRHKVGGAFLAMKAQTTADELNEAKRAIELCGGSLERVYSYTLKNDSKELERAIVVIRKIKDTPKTYPRNNSQISKKPL